MSVDKFGRFNSLSNKIAQGPVGPPGQHGQGFFVTSSGDYNIQGKRLFNLKEAVENKDAVTKIYVDSEIQKLKEAINDLVNSISKTNLEVKRVILWIQEFNKKLIEAVQEFINTNLDSMYKKLCEGIGKKLVMRTRSPWAPSLPSYS